MKKLVSALILLPVAIVLIVLSVANRHLVMFNFDPINPEQPFLAVTQPFFVFLFAAVLIGMVIGSMATWMSQGKYRKLARQQKRDAVKWKDEASEQKERADHAVGQMAGNADETPSSAGALSIPHQAA